MCDQDSPHENLLASKCSPLQPCSIANVSGGKAPKKSPPKNEHLRADKCQQVFATNLSKFQANLKGDSLNQSSFRKGNTLMKAQKLF